MQPIRLSDAEFEVMKALWKLGRPATRVEIDETLRAQQQQWAPTTILTLLSRMGAKGFISSEDDPSSPKYRLLRRYRPLVGRDEYLQAESKSILDKFFGGSPVVFVAALVRGDSLSDEDIRELEQCLREVKDGRE